MKSHALLTRFIQTSHFLILTSLAFTATSMAGLQKTKPDSETVILSFASAVTVLRGGRVSPITKAGMVLQAGDVVKTGKDGKVDIWIGDDAVVRVKPNSTFHLNKLPKITEQAIMRGDTELRLDAGSVLVRLKTLKGQSRFIIETPSATTAARGTAFVLSVDDLGTTVAVEEGRVSMDWATQGVVVETHDVGRVLAATFAIVGNEPYMGRLQELRGLLMRFETTARAGGEIANAGRINPTDGAELAYIPPGEFTMGSNDYSNETNEMPPHTVRLTKGYWMYRTVVTVGQYERFCRETARKMPPEPVYGAIQFNPGWKYKDHPIVMVTFNEAMAYCQWAGTNLPTEAQWEGAAHGPQGFKFPWGNTFDNKMLWSSKSSLGDARGTCSVAKYPANGFGLYDMVGNALQWCRDYYGDKFYKSQVAQEPDPINEEGNDQTPIVRRGGAWNGVNAILFHCAIRAGSPKEMRGNNLGFRCVIETTPQ